MVDAFASNGYKSQSFWAVSGTAKKVGKPTGAVMVDIQPFSVYQQDNPHIIRKRSNHYGASPRCRANANESLDLVRKVMQPAINHDIVEVYKKYISVFQDAAQNISVNMRVEPFTSCATDEELSVESMVYKACYDSLEQCKTLFSKKKAVKRQRPASPRAQPTPPVVASSLPNRLVMKRVPSPDFPWSKRLSGKISERRSLSPTLIPPKKSRSTHSRRYGSPQRGREPSSRSDWDPDKLTLETKFIMGTKANKALGLGATRGRIYMKHPDLFKYSSDPEDKKWMVKNNCMNATGGKNTFILIADDVFDLLDNEYKESPHVMHKEMQVFSLPEFILQKMRSMMVKEKRLNQQLMRKSASTHAHSRSETSSPRFHSKPAARTPPPHHVGRRPAAERAAAFITLNTEDMEEASNGRNATTNRSEEGDSSSGDDGASG